MNINEPVATKAFALPFTNFGRHDIAAGDPNALRLPLVRQLPDSLRNHFIAMCGEFVGTVLFLYFALSGTQVANNINTSSGQSEANAGSNPQQLQYIALAFGFSLAVNAWVFFRISGGLFNPAVTFGMCLIGALPWVRGMLLFIVQILGGITAAALVACMFPGPLTVQTSLGGETTVAQGLFIEMFLTAELVFTIFMLAAEKHKGTFIAPVGIGLSLFVAELTGVFFTGGSLNPARSFGPSVVNTHFEHYHWIYWLGPFLGSIVAAGFYKFIKILEYETANPDQDAALEHPPEDKFMNRVPSNETATTDKTAIGSNGRSGSAHGMPVTSVLGGGLAPVRPMTGERSRSSRPKMSESPAMATNNDAFYGLAHGMHGDDENGDYMQPQPQNTRYRPSRSGSSGV